MNYQRRQGIVVIVVFLFALSGAFVQLTGGEFRDGHQLSLSVWPQLDSVYLDLQPNRILFGAVEPADQEDQATQLAKQLANPISSLISVPFQANEDFGYGPSHNRYKFTLNIQPAIPISISKDWNLIVRTILPIVSQHDLFYVENVPKHLGFPSQNRSQDGLSDTTQSFFLSPKNPGPFGLIWGIGPAFLYPTGTHPFLGTGTWSIGPTAVVLKQQGGWTAGALMNQIWSVAIQEHRKSVSQMFLQPFLAYTSKPALHLP